MSDAKERLLSSIHSEGSRQAERIAWIKKMIERQSNTIENAQKTLDGFGVQLEAAELAYTGLKQQYRELLSEQGNN
mgnify:CR=1 FL=1